MTEELLTDHPLRSGSPLPTVKVEVEVIRDKPNQSLNVLPLSPRESAGSTSSFPFQLAFKYQNIADGLNRLAQHANGKEEQQSMRNQLSQPKLTGLVAQQLDNIVFRLLLWAKDVSIRSPTRTESTAAVLQKLEDAKWPKAEILNTLFENILTCLKRLVAIPEIGLINKKNGEQ